MKAMVFAIKAHDDTNHRYDNDKFPYSVHLAHVVDVGYRFAHKVGLNDDEVAITIAACWCHDTIEDARISYNDLKKVLGTSVAEIVRAVTNYGRGRNRAERMPSFVYEDIAKTPLATFVKLCDRIANIEYSFNTKSSMFSKYANEHAEFKEKLYNDRYAVMFDYIESLFLKKVVTNDSL